MNDERVRTFYQSALEARRDASRAACVPAEQLFSLAEGRLSEAEALVVADHAMACAHCRDEYALLRATLQARPAEHGRARRLALAASIVLVIAAAAFWQGVRVRQASIERSHATTLRLVPPEARTGSTIALVWHIVPGASRYEVELLDAAGSTVQRSITRDTVVLVADSVRIVAGAQHRWWVRAVFPDGRELRSGVDSFRVR